MWDSIAGQAPAVAPALQAEKPLRVPLVERMDFHQVPGVSVAVIDHGEIVWAKGYALHENGRPDQVTPETRFQKVSLLPRGRSFKPG